MLDHNLHVLDVSQYEHEQISTKPGWVDHVPEEIYENVKKCLIDVCKRNDLTSQNIKAVGITNQRETTVAFDRKTGKSLANAIVWLDQRTSSIVDEMKNKNDGNADAYREDCGLPINTYFSA